MPKILIVENDFDFIQIARRAFSAVNYDLITTTNAKGAFQCLQTGTFDALIIDLAITEMNGLKVLDVLQKQIDYRAIPVIVILPERTPKGRIELLKAGAADILERPFFVEELIIRMQRLLHNLHIQEGLEGFLDIYSVADLAQNFFQGKKSGCLEITSNQEKGFLIFHQGQMTKARFAGLKGGEAFWALHELKRGCFKFTPSRKENPSVGQSPLNLQNLLIRAAWVEDEFERVKSTKIPSDRLMKKIKEPFELPSCAELELLSRVLSFFDRNAHHSKNHILEASLASKKRTEFALAWLINNRFLRFASKESGIFQRSDVHAYNSMTI